MACRFLSKFTLIVWVRFPPGTLSETVEQTDSPPVPPNELTKASRTIVRLVRLGRHGMVTASSGWPSLQRIAVPAQSVMRWYGVPTTLPALPTLPPPPPPPPPLNPYTTTALRNAERRLTSGSPREKSQDSLTCPPRLQGCRYPRKRNTSRRLKKVDRERHSVSTPGSVTISFKNLDLS